MMSFIIELSLYYSRLSNTVESYVSRLRAKIEAANVRIRTVRGFGYLWETENG